MPSQHFITTQQRELKRELAELNDHIAWVSNYLNLIPSAQATKLLKYLELRRDTIEQKLANIEAKR